MQQIMLSNPDNAHSHFQMRLALTHILLAVSLSYTCDLLNKASDLTAFYARYSSPHLPVTPAQLMRPGIGRNASCAVGDFT